MIRRGKCLIEGKTILEKEKVGLHELIFRDKFK